MGLLEKETENPEIWQDKEKAVRVTQELNLLKEEVKNFDKLKEELEDIEKLRENIPEEDELSEIIEDF